MQDKGGLDLEELRGAFINLGYLQSLVQNGGSGNPLPQEYEFMANLWVIINPRNLQVIDNAIVYDILLILIYNANNESQSAEYLSEYLEQFYRDEKITDGVDIESYLRR